MLMKPPTVPANHANAPSYDELVNALELIRHATAPTPDDGGHHEAAHDLADSMLKRVEARRQYEASKRAFDTLPGRLRVPALLRPNVEVTGLQRPERTDDEHTDLAGR